ncbi:MAG: hypothetical protein Kow0029_18730 [Candidatus Rifleibacteriota bacterium]
MNRILIILFFLLINTSLSACDDTLITLLTARNPESEFSKTIRAFTSTLSELGNALKLANKKDYTPELEKTMNAWMDFTSKYMTNPPEEARNDRRWAQKMQDTSHMIGKIRKLISQENIADAHNLVLELSSKIGSFFEAVGISDEKKLFIDVSSNLTSLEQMILTRNKQEAMALSASLSIYLNDFTKLIPEQARQTASETEQKISSFIANLENSSDTTTLDPEVLELRSMFEELRSHVLMKEWFPEILQSEKGKKE